jgi:Flp pilus assembly protein TadB
MKESKNTSAGGTGIFTLLFITFLVLKLTGVIDWSWWWVTAPVWVPAGIAALIGILILVLKAVRKTAQRQRRR